ncbi:MAG TPA: hypothetical protein VEM15_14360 [Thermodesulfobacteriota bacterium]|nr:hypothetical protein [Thermodesulfobacteriota bacterium]
MASKTLPAGRQGSNLVFSSGIATPACPAFAEAASRRQAKLLTVKCL